MLSYQKLPVKTFSVCKMILKIAVLCFYFGSTLAIQGGKITDIKDVSYLVSIHKYWVHICSGSLISKNFVLTAAHCTTNGKKGTFKVRLGSNSIENHGLFVDVLKVYQNAKYSPSNFNFDFSVLQLDNYEMNVEINFVKIPEIDISANIIAKVSGWDSTWSKDTVLTTNVSTVSNQNCKAVHKHVFDVTSFMICAKLPSNEFKVCQADSGAGLVIENTIYGVFSYAYECDNFEFPGIYGNVFEIREWLSELIK